MNNLAFSFTIPLYIKELNMIFWMRPPTIETTKSNYKINSSGSYLYIQKVVRSTYGMSDIDKRSLSFTVSRSNLGEIQEMCYDILSWYSREGKEKLYGQSDNGILMFNSEYNGLYQQVVTPNQYGDMVLKMVPNVVEVGNHIMKPGGVMYINRYSNSIIMEEKSIKQFCDFMIHFNFIAYEIFAMQCYNYCNVSGNLLTEQETQELYMRQRGYNSNYR